MRIISKISKALFFLFFLFNHAFIYTQVTFTRIISPSNPVVTDAEESTGICWIDFNNDGYLDVFVSNGNLTSRNNSLYLNDRAGSFRKIISGQIVNDGGSSIGGTWSDLNNDGKLDLFVSNRNNFGNFLYLGNGDTTFTKVTAGRIVTDIANSNSSGWTDFNRDGFIDLFVVNFNQNDYFYFNNGSPGFNFTNLDTSAFLIDGAGPSIVGYWADVNNDRFPDFFIGNGSTDNDFIYVNNGNFTFTKTTFNDARATLGVSFGDFDNDGDLDIYTSCFLNQNNRLYINGGAPGFVFTPVDTGIVSNDQGNSVGSCWGDFDNDGDLDIFVANDGQNNFLYLNSGPPSYSFSKVTAGSIVNDGGNTFGCAAGDYDNDGQLDILTANRLNQLNFLYKNDGNNNNWITIKCIGTVSNKAAIGTKVRIKALINGVPRWQMQEITPQSGYNSQNLWLHFGLGNAAVIDSIKVEWINGLTHYFTDVPLNDFIEISESGNIIGINSQSHPVIKDFILYQNYPNPFNPSTTIKFETKLKMKITIEVFDVNGRSLGIIAGGEYRPGIHEARWNPVKLSSGVYYYRLTAGGYSDTKKMLLIK